MSTELDEFLEHHGVKGQKWGVRKDYGHVGERVKLKNLPKLDAAWEKEATSTKTWVDIHNVAADLTNRNDVARINNKPQYKNHTFSEHFDASPLERAYLKEHQDAFLANVRKVVGENNPQGVAIVNPSGTKKIGIINDKDGNWGVKVVPVSAVHVPLQHADDGVLFTVNVTKDSTGHITNLEVMLPLAHGESIDEFLEHHGVKGMRWGVRRSRGRVASEDHIRTHELAKKHVSTLHNKQIEDVNRRINLETTFARNTSIVNRGNAKARELLQVAGTATALYALASSPAGKAVIARGAVVVKNMMENASMLAGDLAIGLAR